MESSLPRQEIGVKMEEHDAFFGGFKSNKLETMYNKTVFAMLFLLQNTLIRFFKDGKLLILQ